MPSIQQKIKIKNNINMINYKCIKEGDDVLFSINPNSVWKKGKVTSTNFAMCNLPDFFEKPTYYVTEYDGDVMTEQIWPIPVDSLYIVKYEPGMESCIGQLCYNHMPAVNSVKDFNTISMNVKEKQKMDARCSLTPYTAVLVRHANGKWHADWFEYYLNSSKTTIHTIKGYDILSCDDWVIYDNDKQYRELLKLDDDFVCKSDSSEECKEDNFIKEICNDIYNKIIDLNEKYNVIINKLNTIISNQNVYDKQIYPTPYIPYINPYDPTTTDPHPYNPERWKIYCNNGDSSIKSHITLDEIEKYRTTFSGQPSKYSCDCSKNDNYIESISVDEYNNYNSTTTSADMNSEFCQTCLDSNIDTYGLYKANNNINNKSNE